MKQSIKTIISIVMVLTIAIICMPMSMASEVYSGTCGDNLTWTLDTETGELVISGEGEMYDYSSEETPWFENRLKINSIVVNDGVSRLGDWSFMDCDSLTNVVIPESVIEIGSAAFYDCDSLTIIVIPDSVESIAFATFRFCDQLESVSIGECVTYIGSNAFEECVNLESVNIPDSVTEIGMAAFYSCESLKSLEFGKGLSYIYAWAFEGCSSLVELSFYSKLNTIGESAFNACNIKSIYFFGTQETWNNIFIDRKNDAIINATIHFLGESEHKHDLAHRTVASTCTVAGMEYDICLECGESFNIVTLPLAAHSWSKWMTRTEATGSAYGEKYRTCTVCGKEETDSIPKLNVIEDEKTGIEIEFDNEYNSDVEIKVEEVFDGSSFELLEKAYGGVKSKVFDISTIKDGIKVQPDGKVKVRIPLPNGFGKNSVWVNYIDSVNGTVTKIPSTVVNGYVEFETDHFSYYGVVEELSKVNSVSIDNISMSYKDSTTITPTINADEGVGYTVSYSSSDTGVAQVDEKGKVTATGKGSAEITCTVTDEYGNTVTDTCNVEVKYTFWQWIIVIVLFGWIWY